MRTARVGPIGTRALTALALSWAAVVAPPVRPLAAQAVTWSGSLHYASGSYVFSEPTHTWVLSSRLSGEAGPMRIAIGLPLVLQNSGAVTTVGGGLLPTGGPDYMALRGRTSGEVVPMRGSGGRRAAMSTAAVTDSVAGPGAFELNVGDPLLDLGLDVYRGTGGVRWVTIGAMAKVPLASLESGVGTGRWDGGAALSVGLGIGPATLFGDVEYWSYGDLPDLELRDGPAYGVGLGVPLSPRLTGLLSLDGSSAVLDGVAAPLSVGAALGYVVAPGRSLTIGVGAGLSEASPDVAAFVGWRIGLGP